PASPPPSLHDALPISGARHDGQDRRLPAGGIRHRRRPGGDPRRPAPRVAGRAPPVRTVIASLDRPMRRIPLLVVVLALAGCGKTNPHLLPQANADALTASADRIRQACDADDRSTARDEIRNAEKEIAELPAEVSAGLKAN